MNQINTYLEKSRMILEKIGSQQNEIEQAAEWFAKTILAGRMVHVFGSGHSRIMVEEMWPRYGSFTYCRTIPHISQPRGRGEWSTPSHVPRKCKWIGRKDHEKLYRE
jgi:hypothetical protein